MLQKRKTTGRPVVFCLTRFPNAPGPHPIPGGRGGGREARRQPGSPRRSPNGARCARAGRRGRPGLPPVLLPARCPASRSRCPGFRRPGSCSGRRWPRQWPRTPGRWRKTRCGTNRRTPGCPGRHPGGDRRSARWRRPSAAACPCPGPPQSSSTGN